MNHSQPTPKGDELRPSINRILTAPELRQSETFRETRSISPQEPRQTETPRDIPSDQTIPNPRQGGTFRDTPASNGQRSAGPPGLPAETAESILLRRPGPSRTIGTVAAWLQQRRGHDEHEELV